jgi:hypothetical protein
VKVGDLVTHTLLYPYVGWYGIVINMHHAHHASSDQCIVGLVAYLDPNTSVVEVMWIQNIRYHLEHTLVVLS